MGDKMFVNMQFGEKAKLNMRLWVIDLTANCHKILPLLLIRMISVPWKSLVCINCGEACKLNEELAKSVKDMIAEAAAEDRRHGTDGNWRRKGYHEVYCETNPGYYGCPK